jgi:hypothetical protein
MELESMLLTDSAALRESIAAWMVLVPRDVARVTVQDWLLRHGQRLLREKKHSLGVLIETGSLLGGTPQADLLFAILDDPEAEPSVARIAAQRVRQWRPLQADVRQDVAGALMRWIDRWILSPKTRQWAVVALPSVAYMSVESALPWLATHIRHADRQLAWAAATGVAEADWSELSIENLVEALLLRWQDEQAHDPDDTPGEPDLPAMLVFALGRVATPTTIQRVAQVLGQAYLRGRGLEDAMAIMTGATFLRRGGEAAWLAMGTAIPDRDRLMSFLHKAQLHEASRQ